MNVPGVTSTLLLLLLTIKKMFIGHISYFSNRENLLGSMKSGRSYERKCIDLRKVSPTLPSSTLYKWKADGSILFLILEAVKCPVGAIQIFLRPNGREYMYVDTALRYPLRLPIHSHTEEAVSSVEFLVSDSVKSPSKHCQYTWIRTYMRELM